MISNLAFRILAFVFGLIVTNVCFASSAMAQADFYKGKTITVIAGTTPGALYDQWSRLLAAHMGKHIPGKPDMIVQNMPGAGHMIAANYLYNRTKPDGLTIIGSIVPSLYFDQLIGRKEAQYDWGKFVWIGSPVQGESQMYMRADTPYKSIEDVRNAKEPPRCGAQGTSDSAYYLPKLFEELIGTKFNLVQGYPGLYRDLQTYLQERIKEVLTGTSASIVVTRRIARRIGSTPVSNTLASAILDPSIRGVPLQRAYRFQ
jgi:tripartite-type tricarboxylate transporter receptor subunit TctC